MRLLAALTLVIGLTALAGCGSTSASAASVVRAWSRALNADDNEAAASLFAKDAQIVQGPTVTRLRTHADAVAFNESLPCSGRIVSLSRDGDSVTATFVLGDRKTSACDGPGQHASALFEIRRGKIVLWHQVAGDNGDSGPTV